MGDTGDTPTREQSPDDVARQTPRPRFARGEPLPNLEMWTLDRRLGGGGFGEVWLARHERKGLAAVKFCTDPAAKHQLVTHERAVVARVMKHAGDHPNIVPLLECNLSGDIPWLMYEYVEGGTLAEALEGWRALTAPRRLGRAVQVLRALSGALAAFHRLAPPLVHRDLKPQNVLMAGGKVPRITDFGIGGLAVEAGRADKPDPGSNLAVRVPTLLRAFGSSRYAPPEQFLGSPPHPRDDVFALGVIAYQLVLADPTADPEAGAAGVLRRLKVPPELARLIVASAHLDPERRPPDAGVWARELGALVGRKTPAPPPPPADESRDDVTEPMEALTEAVLASAVTVTQALEVPARGRWYVRPAGPPGPWRLVAVTPAEVRVVPGELYRFSIHSGATEEDVSRLAVLSGLRSLVYLNLSYCAGVTDAGLEGLKEFAGVRQLYLCGCPRLSDAGLAHLRVLAHLRLLDLTGCPGLTAAAVAELRAALPGCDVVS